MAIESKTLSLFRSSFFAFFPFSFSPMEQCTRGFYVRELFTRRYFVKSFRVVSTVQLSTPPELFFFCTVSYRRSLRVLCCSPRGSANPGLFVYPMWHARYVFLASRCLDPPWFTRSLFLAHIVWCCLLFRKLGLQAWRTNSIVGKVGPRWPSNEPRLFEPHVKMRQPSSCARRYFSTQSACSTLCDEGEQGEKTRGFCTENWNVKWAKLKTEMEYSKESRQVWESVIAEVKITCKNKKKK